jgi:CDP-4-dehydro-6-deoxyglucose reductase
MATVALTLGQHLEAGSTESLLDAAIRNGLSLPYSCRTGRCSTCKAQVVAGHTVPLLEESGLCEDERAVGWILTCARAATSDVVLDVEDLGDLGLAAPRTVPCRIQSIEYLRDDVACVRLRLPPAAAFSYQAGQYVEIIGPEGVRRSYSIANAPAPGTSLEFHIRRVQGGALSRYWFQDARVNDLLRLYGPLGTFVLRGVARKELVCLATGTGIAPIKAMLEEIEGLTAEEKPRKTTVYWGVREEGDHYMKLQLSPDVDLVQVLSRGHGEWPGARGHVQDVMLSRTSDLSDTVVFACGSDAMIQTSRRRLFSAGLLQHRFFSDAFVCSARP